jgi:hypothetical protein
MRRLWVVISLITCALIGGLLGACSGSPAPAGDDAGGDSEVRDAAAQDAAADHERPGDGAARDAGADAPDATRVDASDGATGDETGDDGSPEDSGDASDSGPTNDANDGGFDADDAALIQSYVAFENLTELVQQQSLQGYVVADFYDTSMPPNPCVVTTFGACTSYDCQVDSGLYDAGVTPVSAGTLTAAGGDLPDGGLPLMQQPSGSYVYNQPSLLFAAGDTLSAEATGGIVPAFGPQTVVAPAAISLLMPLPNGQGTYVISTAQDLPVTWSGGEANAQVVFELVSFAPSSFAITGCTWDASMASAKVPSAAMTGLLGGFDEVLWGQSRTTTFDAGSISVQLMALQATGASAVFQ